ncbi:MAG: exodeoxyribonuclease VII large subunit [Tannerella sp.]|jgi:exodeoxyribonuclease VII large subunit|nr:exodeoxyribonuclease VII large subunit [Tannerella sp.]
MDLFTNIETPGALSLSELNELVRDVISVQMPDAYWVRAEMTDVRTNASSGHCYLEFIEKDEQTGQIVAKARGTIWARTFHILKPYFEDTTRQRFASGLKVLVKVSVEFHVLYGYSLTVLDIDPSYTLGDLVKKRQEIVRRLQEEGIFELNKELPFPELPQRIAVITSQTAAGYEDFVHHLCDNKAGYPFYLKLFPAMMQGEKAEQSIIAALDRVWQYAECFDAVVVIRGGGSVSDLNCFDSYQLAAHCAQFPLPVLTGIGHERDDSIVDMVAHTRMKTPTAVADFLIARMDEQADEVEQLQQTVCGWASEVLATHQSQLNMLTARIPAMVIARIEQNRTRLSSLRTGLAAANLFVMKQHAILTGTRQSLQSRVTALIAEKHTSIDLLGQYVKMASPDYILKRGYTLILKNGVIVKQASQLKTGDELAIRFADGERTAHVE